MQKRLLSLTFILLLLLTVLAGCAGDGEPSVQSETGQTISETDTTGGGETAVPDRSENSSETQSTEETGSAVTTEPETEESKLAETESSKQQEEKTTAETSRPEPETKPAETTKVTDPPQSETSEPVQTTEPEESKTTETTEPPTLAQADSSEVAALVAKYINQYRSSAATVLPGLSEVAIYRAKELVTDFSHTDGRSACNALQYGEYVDMTLYGMSESDNYYRGYNREAIAKGNWTGTADEIAERIASGFKASTNHWAYVGSNEYGYMAVGVVYDPSSSTWFCCICMSSKNYGG